MFGFNLAGAAPDTADEQIPLWARHFAVIATEGDAGPSGETYGSIRPSGLPGELFGELRSDPCIFPMAGNSVGDFVNGGMTSAFDEGADAVIVLSNWRVTLREGDGVDLNGDGLANDNAHLGVFGNESMYLDDDDKLYFAASLRDGLDITIGQAFFRYARAVCAGDMNCDGRVNFDDTDFFVLARRGQWQTAPPGARYGRAADMHGDLLVTFDDISGFVGAIGTTSP